MELGVGVGVSRWGVGAGGAAAAEGSSSRGGGGSKRGTAPSQGMTEAGAAMQGEVAGPARRWGETAMGMG